MSDKIVNMIKSHFTPGSPTLITGPCGSGKIHYLKLALSQSNRDLLEVNCMFCEDFHLQYEKLLIQKQPGNVAVVFESIESCSNRMKDFVITQLKNPDRIFFGTYYQENKLDLAWQKAFPRSISFST